MAKDITIYTTNTCAYCVMVKKWLTAKGHGYTEVNIEEHPERANEAISISGQTNVPVTVITNDDNSQSVVVGYNLAKLAPAVA
jgi:glutaredoxin